MNSLLALYFVSSVSLIVGAGLLHLIPKLGPTGKVFSAWLCKAPGLDVLIAYFSVAPMIAGLIVGAQAFGTFLGSLAGLGVGVGSQVTMLLIWTWCHEFANRKHLKGPRIVSHINARVGPVRNHAALWVTAMAVPVFAFARFAEYIVYPPLTWLIRLPKYKSAEWVNVSRHKFEGLVGHDLIWCLYCDWMTGVWSYGTEMLRNVESFWCPIRFDSTKKCENCKVDFPDVDNGWAPADGTMADAVKALDDHYPGPNGDNHWFGHPARLTVNGEAAEVSSQPPS
ncbi:MAG: hypothetical protein AAFS11_01705 [Planctomycetota bacterium]